MAETPTGFLVQRRDDGFGDVYPLIPGQRYTLGRSPECRITLRDDLCSRRHAEIALVEKAWSVRDLGSLNGTAVNEESAKTPIPLEPLDTVRLGRTNLVFVRSIDELPAPPALGKQQHEGETLEIVRRLGQTKYLPPPVVPPSATVKETVVAHPVLTATAVRVAPAEALGLLYRLALDMAEAATQAELAELTIEALLRATPAEVGAVLVLKEGKELQPLAYRSRPGVPATYHKVSHFVGREVLATRQAVLAEDVSRDKNLQKRESLTELQVASLICSPILADGATLGVIHLYRIGPSIRLNADDLELTLAAAQQLGSVLQRFRKQSGLSLENQQLRSQLRLESEMVGASAPLKQVEQQILRVAPTRATVLVRGESGVGKELVARAIHFESPRRDLPFVCLNCAALTESLLESELFGHEKGAFTGATDRMVGKFEAADQGTIFLDEIGEMSVNTQAKFLRVLEGQTFERVGGNTPIRVDVRVVAATNRALEEAVRGGQFRKDLYFRLQVVQIDVPPLRDRVADIEPLANHFLKRFVRETGRKVKGFTPAALAKLSGYSWPGNVRELRNVIERAVALGNSSVVDVADVWLSPLELDGDTARGYEPVSLVDQERLHIEKTLAHTSWNKSKAAEILGIERSTLDRKIKAYDLKK